MNPTTIDKNVPVDFPRQDIRVVECVGSPFNMGVAQGETLRESIRDALEAIGDLEAFRLLAPPYLPFGLFRRIAEEKSDRFLRRALRATTIDAAERLPGIARGAGVPKRKLALCCLLEAVLSDLTRVAVDGPTGLEAGCSAVAITGSASATGEPMLVHNFDYLPTVQPFYFIRRSRPAGKLRSLDFSMSPLAGAVDGINEAGLAITCNYAYVTDKSDPAPTITMLIADALARCRTVDETVEFLSRQPRVGGGLLMIADEEGTLASVEVSNSRVRRRDPEPGTDRIFHTNRLRCASMQAVELSSEAHHGTKAPRALRGRRVHQSADSRLAAIQRQLEQRSKLTLEDLHAIMSDHGDGPSPDTVCVHGEYWHTTACTQLLPAERKLRASFSTACMAEFRELDV